MQGTFDSLGQVVIFQALRQERGGRLGSVLLLSGVLARGKRGGLAHRQYPLSSAERL